MYKLLICEDNIELSDMMRNYLVKNGNMVFQAFDGIQALSFFENVKTDIILLDIMMPSLDGREVCKKIRKTSSVPIIVISALMSENDKICMFELGVDDYIVKPFSFKEMVLRVNALLKRSVGREDENNNITRVYGRLSINSEQFEVKVDGENISLTAKEFKILDLLTSNKGQVFTKNQILDKVWGESEFIEENTVTVAVARLREKLGKSEIDNIVTIWGVGYKWQE